MGVNEDAYSSDMDVVSNASPNTHCISPILKVLDDTCGIEEALLTSIHSV